ncbi:UBX domain containing protein [Ceratobasidium theobromae]|uniref:UBX domain containing protein n=1 Tax=Ceratobasidium theobromae TaxID=1582974 RepID=A0A5N5QML5_9AGAM|nr:UBX domain containing protein [Ceratobasidium theobromae]
MSDASKATDAAGLISQSQQASSIISPEPSGATNPAIAQAPFKLWNPPTEARPAVAPILDDLEPTAAEVVAAYQAQARRAENLRNAPLLTQEMRDRQEQEKYKKWPNCTIRIRFHNQMQLEKAFPSTNKIKSVYAFVRECLNEETKAIKFVLYQPPARELKVSDTSVRDKTLMELQLAPSSVLLLRFLSDELNDREKVPPLDQSVLATAVDFPTVTPSADGVSVAPVASMAKQSNKAVENKLAKLFKLQPRK